MRHVGWLVLCAAVCSCTPTTVDRELGVGDYAATSHLSRQGLETARDANRRAAQRRCPGGFVTFGETSGSDDRGTYIRLEYGCSAP